MSGDILCLSQLKGGATGVCWVVGGRKRLSVLQSADVQRLRTWLRMELQVRPRVRDRWGDTQARQRRAELLARGGPGSSLQNPTHLVGALWRLRSLATGQLGLWPPESGAEAGGTPDWLGVSTPVITHPHLPNLVGNRRVLHPTEANPAGPRTGQQGDGEGQTEKGNWEPPATSVYRGPRVQDRTRLVALPCLEAGFQVKLQPEPQVIVPHIPASSRCC